MLVYLVTNTKNGKKYVGQTTSSLAHRWSQHCCPGSTCYYLSRAIKAHGRDAFTIEVIGSAETKAELDALELALTDEHKSWIPYGYNATKTDTWKKIGRKQTGVKRGPMSLEHRQRISAGLIKATGIPVVGISDAGDTIFLAYTKVAKAFGMDPVAIRQCLHGVTVRSYGRRWLHYADFVSGDAQDIGTIICLRARAGKRPKALKATHAVTGEVLAFESVKDATAAGYHKSIVKACCDGLRESYKGRVWEWAA